MNNCLAMLLSFSMLFLSVQSLASMPNEKVYATGDSLAKPMIMSRFIEMSYARRVAEVPFKNLQDETVKLSDYRGKLVLINLWATWCAPCIKEIPMMDKIRRDNQEKNLVVLPLSIDEEHDKVAAFLDRHQYTDYPSLIDPQQLIEQMLPADVVPATYVFDGEGNLVGFLRGYLDWGDEKVQPYLEKLIIKYAKPIR
jgi:thiol-disulfide isomerase/thioredoxin